MKKSFITGVTGQVGSYLAELLLEKDYEVYGLIRRSSTENKWRITKALKEGLQLIDGDITDAPSLNYIFKTYGPFDEVYNLAAQSDVGLSWKQPISTAKITGLGCMNILEAIRQNSPESKFLQASTSELFGKSLVFPQDENTIIAPRSPYGVSKAFAHYATINYRESYDLFACCSICYNNESPRRGINFVTQKIVQAAKRIAIGEQDFLYLGNLDSIRDWSHSRDMVKGMWLALQQDEPEEYLFASGTAHTVEEFCKATFDVLDLDYKEYVKINPEFIRPAEVHKLVGDSTKAKTKLHWKQQYDFDSLIEDMVFNTNDWS